MNTSNIHTATNPFIVNSKFLQVKSRIAQTAKIIRQEDNNAMPAVYEPAKRVVLSAKYEKRPQSAQYQQDDPFSNNVQKQ